MFKHAFSVLLVALAFLGGNAQAIDQIQHKLVTVASTNDEWTSTGIQAGAGDLLLVFTDPREKYRIGAFLGSVNADGTQSGEGALFVKSGVGAGVRIGMEGMVGVANPGEVKLKIKDSNYGDNSGLLHVRVIHIPASAIPPAEQIATP